jgi:hypothetical protein
MTDVALFLQGIPETLGQSESNRLAVGGWASLEALAETAWRSEDLPLTADLALRPDAVSLERWLDLNA